MSALLVAIVGGPAAALAQESPGSAVVVRVLDSSERGVDARVMIVGTGQGQSVQGLTRDGVVRFSLRAGRYWISVEARGYQALRERIDVADDSIRQAVFHLVELKEIGHVQSRSNTNVTTSSARSASRRISRDLAEALNSVAGVSAIGGDGALGIRVSLQGQDESLTHFQFGGAPLSANAAALAVNTDLIQSVQVDESRNLIQFIGLGPAPTPTTHLRARAGSYGSVFESASFQDTFGQTGVAVLHTLRAEESPLNGTSYRDTSGLDYRHVGALHTVGNYVSVSGPVGSWAGSGLGAYSENRASPLATYLVGSTPVGTGPGETQAKSAANMAFSLNGTLNSNSLAMTYAQFDSITRDSQLHRSVDGVSFPFDLRQRASVQTFSASVERALTNGVTADASIQVFNQVSTAARLSLEAIAADHIYDTQIELRSPDHTGWSIAYKGGTVNGQPHGSLTVRSTRRAGRNVTLTGLLSDGTIAQEGNDARRARGWIDPYAADFDCMNGAIVTEGPGDAGATPHEFRAFGSATFESHSVHGSIAAWQSKTHGQLLTDALVPLLPGDPTTPPRYWSDLLTEASSSLRCGAGRSGYSVFPRRDIAGESVSTHGLTIALSADRGPTHAEFSLDLVSARLDKIDPRLVAPQSLYISGRQLPGVPAVRATLVLDRALTRDTEALASLHYESSNNRFNLSPFIVTSVGIARKLSPVSSLSIVAGNVFNTDAGTFVSSRYAVPVLTESGGLLRGVAAPLAPFRLSIQLDFSLGK